MMNKAALILFFLLASATFASAQKYAFVDSKYILGKIPAYKEAQKQLDNLSDKWQEEVKVKLDKIAEKEQVYQDEKILWPDDVKEQKKAEIAALKEEVQAFQRKKFGVNGELFQKREELIKPIQDKLYQAIKDVSKERYSMVFDKANQSNLLYGDSKYDISDKVLKKMGF